VESKQLRIKLQKYIAKQKCTVKTVSCEVLNVGKKSVTLSLSLKNQNSITAGGEKGYKKKKIATLNIRMLL
jgi:hypothetical protein